MAATDRITGKDVYVTFGGTVLSGDQTAVSISQEGDLVDLTAAADAFHNWVSLAREDGEVSVESYWAGTATFQKVDVLTAGTLIIAPKGTATLNPKYTWANAIVKSRDHEMPFDDGVTWSVTFALGAALVEGAY